MGCVRALYIYIYILSDNYKLFTYKVGVVFIGFSDIIFIVTLMKHTSKNDSINELFTTKVMTDCKMRQKITEHYVFFVGSATELNSAFYVCNIN